MWTEIAMFGNSSKKDNLGKWAKSQLQNVHDCAQFCPTLCGPRTAAHQVTLSMEFNASILEQLAISYSRIFFQLRDRTHISHVSCITGGFFTTAPSGKPNRMFILQANSFPFSFHSQLEERAPTLAFLETFLFYIGVQLTNNVVIASGHGRLTQPYIHMYYSPPNSLPDQAEQTSLDSTFFCASQSIHSELLP